MFSNQHQFINSLKNSLRIAHSQNYRVMLVLAGKANQHLEIVCEEFEKSVNGNARDLYQAQTVTKPTNNIMHVPDLHSNSDVSDKINSLLGSEHRCIVFDAQCTFDERLFAAAAGTITAGGLLILRTPPLHKWSEQIHTAAKLSSESQFVQRFCEKLILHHAAGVGADASTAGRFNALKNTPANAALFISSSTLTPESKNINTALAVRTDTWELEQDTMLDTLINHLLNKAVSVCVVQGDRGRGKSALIGRALKRCLTTDSFGTLSISVTANRRSACDVLLRHAKQSIPFLSIEKALSMSHDVLIVEEAGSIPIPVLEQLLHQCQSIVFATTVQGYEGAGRGFAIRFAKTLDELKPGWLRLTPSLPIRWSRGDPLEAFINDALMLETRIPAIEQANALSPNDARVNLITKPCLAADDTLLAEVYGLLVQAHYQTTPADLRNLLDQSQLLVFAQRTGKVLTGAALVALEGAIPIELHQSIMHKQRRLSDQILPQLLAQSAGESNALGERFARVVRIAVHPAIHQRGFGTHLFENLRRQLSSIASEEGGVTSIGASFGADQLTLAFWLKLGLKPIHYGYKANPRSALRAACLMTSTNPLIAQTIDKASRILHLNTQAQALQNAAPNPIQAQLINATKGTDHVQLSALETRRLITDFYLSRRSFADTVGLLLSDKHVCEDVALNNAVRRTLKGYTQMPPKTRRMAEAQLRTALLESGTIVDSN